MGAPNPDVTALVNQLALQYWTVANRPNLSAVVAAVTAQLSRLGGEINSAVIAYAQARVTAVFTAEEATESAHGGPAAGGTITLGAFGSSPAPEGASVSGSVLTMQPADATHPGEVSTAAQSFAGLKTLVNDGALGTGAVSGVASGLKTVAARYTRTTPVAIANASVVVFDFNLMDFDTNSAVTTGVAWHFTSPTGQNGLYQIAGFVKINASGQISQYVTSLRKNAATISESQVVSLNNTGADVAISVPAIVSLVAGDTIDVTNFIVATGSITGTGQITIARIPGS